MTRVYLSGPITGMPDLGRSNFAKGKSWCLTRGLTPVSPADIPIVDGENWEYYMRKALVMMLSCDSIVMLPGWRLSRGARIEHGLACILKMTVEEM